MIYNPSISFYNSIEFLMLLYTSLEIRLTQYKRYIIWRISFSKFSDVLPAFTCARAVGNLWSICLGVNILSCLHSDTLAARGKYFHIFSLWLCSFGRLSKTLWTFCLPLRSIIAFLRIIAIFTFFFFEFVDLVS